MAMPMASVRSTLRTWPVAHRRKHETNAARVRELGRCGRAEQLVDALRCHSHHFAFSEIPQLELSEHLAFEDRVGGVGDEYLPRRRRMAELEDAERRRSQLAARDA